MLNTLGREGRQLVDTCRTHWRAILTYVLIILFYLNVVHDARPVELASMGLVFPAWVPHILFRAIVDFAGVIAFAQIASLASRRSFRIACVAIGVAGSALSIIFMDHPLPHDNWPPVLGAALTAISTFYLACVLLQLGCRIGVAANLRCILMAAIVGLPFVPIFLALPHEVVAYAMPVVPAIVYALLVTSSRGVERIRRNARATVENLFVPARFLLTGLVDGATFGLFVSIGGWSANLVLSFGIAALASSVLLFFLIVVRNITYNDILFRIEFPLGAFALLMMLPFGSDAPLPSLVFLATFIMRYTTVLTLNIYHVSRYDLPVVWVGGYMDFARNFGQMVGFAVPVLFLSQAGADPSASNIAIVGAIVCLVASVYLQSESNDRTDWGHSRVYKEDEPLTGLELACKRIVSEYALSKREADVLLPLARGNSQKSIAEQLYISAETVKTHTRSIYRKLGIHSKQELIDFANTRTEAK